MPWVSDETANPLNADECDCGKYCGYDKIEGEDDEDQQIPLSVAFEFAEWCNIEGWKTKDFREIQRNEFEEFKAKKYENIEGNTTKRI